MKKLVCTVLFTLVFVGAMAQETKKVFGKVSDGVNLMENVNVSIMDKKDSIATDAEGNYEIEVKVGDRLQFSYTGMRTVTILIEDVTRVLNPVLIPDVTELEEVEVAASKRRSQKEMEEDYIINKNIIRTAWGFLDTDRAPGNIRTVDEEEITIVNLNVPTLLVNRFPFVSFSQEGWVQLRGPMPAAYDIDGQIFAPVRLPGNRFTQAPQLNIGNIKRIGIINNLAATAAYGTLGQGGVVVINTMGGSPTNDEFVDRARLRNNYANGSELSRAEVAMNAPTYLKEMRASGSFGESKAIFERYHATYSNSPYFLLDAYTHFVEDHGQEEYADDIISEYFVPYTNNPVLMKALAYTYESQQRYEKANEANKEVFILRPNYVQSYMDMANSYRNLGESKQAASMYARYYYLVDEGFLEQDTIGFGPIVDREFNNLLMLNKGAVVDSRKARKLFVAKEEEGTRLVFEWNDSEAEFELQFVNPENQFYMFKHSLAADAETIAREKDFGYNIKEYLVDGSLPGTWKVNVNYLGNKSLTPTYLKATIYYDYGSRTQRKETMVFKLDLRNVNQELFSLTTSGSKAVR